MALSAEKQVELRNATLNSAASFVEDMEYLRSMVSRKDTDKREVRHVSAILRRLIVERELSKISAPRLGKVVLTAPDVRLFHRASEQLPFLFYMTGGANVFDGRIGRMYAFDVQAPKHMREEAIFEKLRERLPKPEDADVLVHLSLDAFAQQKVMCFRGTWITRQEIIKYVANVSSGVHSGEARDEIDKIVAQVRGSTSISIAQDGGLHLELFRHGIDSDEAALDHSRDHIDLVLVELLASATYLTISPMLEQLEYSIREELAPPVKPMSA